MFALALRTLLRNSTPEAAIVALQPLSRLCDAVAFSTMLVIRHRDGAVLALDLVSTTAAHHHKRISAPVQQNDRLLSAIERALGLFNQPSRKDLLLTRLAKLIPNIHQLHRRQRTRHHALPHLHARVTSLLCIRPALERRLI